MGKVILMFMCIATVHLSLSSSVKNINLERNNEQSHLKDYGTTGLGYWLSYPAAGDECSKCNCSLNATVIKRDIVVNAKEQFTTEFWTIFMNKSDCTGEASSISHKCHCYGNPDILIGQIITGHIQFIGTMGDSNCFGSYYQTTTPGFLALTCHGQKRSETMVTPL